MTEIQNILKIHGIESVKLQSGVIIAIEENEQYTNVTDWSWNKLYRWLGY